MEGFKSYRHNSNPKEKELHDKFVKEHLDEADFIVFGQKEGTGFVPKDYLNDREQKIVISTIQWLGSPVGQSFLKECGFDLKTE